MLFSTPPKFIVLVATVLVIGSSTACRFNFRAPVKAGVHAVAKTFEAEVPLIAPIEDPTGRTSKSGGRITDLGTPKGNLATTAPVYHIPEGENFATFTFHVGVREEPITAPIVVFDVYSPSKRMVLASKGLRSTMLLETRTLGRDAEINVGFFHDKSYEPLVFRVKYVGITRIEILKVSVASPLSEPLVLDAKEVACHEVGKASEEGWEADVGSPPGRLLTCGPELGKLARGLHQVTFTLHCSSAQAISLEAKYFPIVKLIVRDALGSTLAWKDIRLSDCLNENAREYSFFFFNPAYDLRKVTPLVQLMALPGTGTAARVEHISTVITKIRG